MLTGQAVQDIDAFVDEQVKIAQANGCDATLVALIDKVYRPFSHLVNDPEMMPSEGSNRDIAHPCATLLCNMIFTYAAQFAEDADDLETVAMIAGTVIGEINMQVVENLKKHEAMRNAGTSPLRPGHPGARTQ